MADTEECGDLACFWIAEVIEIHSDMTREIGSIATETGRLRYCIRGMSKDGKAASKREEPSIVLDNRAFWLMVQCNERSN